MSKGDFPNLGTKNLVIPFANEFFSRLEMNSVFLLLFHLPKDFGTAPFTFRAKLCSDAFTLGDHPLVYFFPNAFYIIKAFYAHIVEGGSAPHLNKGQFAGTQHPGTPPQPFFYPPFRLLLTRAKRRFGRAIAKGIKKAV